MNMVVSPLGKGLFRRAMSESGGMYTKPTAYARNLANTTIEQVIRYKEGVDAATATQRRIAMENNGTLEAYLRPIDAGTFFLAIIKYGSLVTYDGIEDGTVLPVGGWIPAIKAGKHNKVPIILGSNQYESKAFMPLYGPAIKPLGVPSGPYNWFNLQDVLKGNKKADGTPFTLNDVLPTQADKDLYELTGYYGSRNWKAKYVDTVAHELSKVQDDVYAYLFKWGGIGSGPSPFDFIYGAGHAAEIPFFFGSDHGLFGYPFVPANEAGRKDLQHDMMEYLANFAWTGNPNHYFPCPPWLEKWSHFTCPPRWKEWSNAPGAPKAIVFDADFHRAKISMTSEELTVQGVTAELIAAISALPANAQYVAGAFQFSPPW
jgi:para-nitrobenzyl esterase